MSFLDSTQRPLVRELIASGVSRAHAYRLVANGETQPRRRALALGARRLRAVDGASTASAAMQLHDAATDLDRLSPIELLHANRRALVDEEDERARLIQAVVRADDRDRLALDPDASECDLLILEADLRAGLARVEATRSADDMRAIVDRLTRARAAYERVAHRRALVGEPPPWPIPDGETIYVILDELSRCPLPLSNAGQIERIDREIARIGGA